MSIKTSFILLIFTIKISEIIIYAPLDVDQLSVLRYNVRMKKISIISHFQNRITGFAGKC